MNQQIALIMAAQQGNATAFAQLVTQFQNLTYAVAYGATGDRHLAEEAAQEAFIEVYRPLDLVVGVDAAMVEFLLQRGAVVDIFAAVTLGDIDRVRDFLAGDPSLARAHGPEGATPLHLATTVELAQLLLDHGADINVPDHYTKRPPVGWGWGPKRDPIHQFLIAKGARVDSISLACRIGDVERVRAFLDADPALLHTRTPTWDDHGEGATLLHIAASRNRVAVVKLLIERGADVNAKGGWWVVTPLHWAADNGHTEIVRLLIKHGADVNVRTEEHGYTPLHWAAGNGHRATVELLIAASAAVDAQSDDGEMPNLQATETLHTPHKI